MSIDLSEQDLADPQPLILTDTDDPNFILPSEKDILIIPRNTSILLACPGENNSFGDFESTQLLKATCVAGQIFLVDSRFYLFSTFKCKRLPQETIINTTFSCLGKHTKYEIGFKIENHFLKLLEVCRDESNYRNYYSKHILVKEINNRQSGYPRPPWKSGPYYPRCDIDQRYTFKFQRETLKNLLGSEELAKKYVYFDKGNPVTEWQSLHRGHLTPKTDFLYGPHQWITFWFLNTNPQWGNFNSGNWMHLENDVRNFAESRKLDLVVYTGVHGIATLNDINNNEQLLYLYVNDTEQLLPVPRFFWKIIHDPISNLATAFIGMNEPYADDLYEDMYLCPDISLDYDFSWLTWQPINIRLGVSYVCTVDSLRKAVSSVPEIGEIGVLV